VLTDQISDLLFTTERSALANLVREGIDPRASSSSAT
jgi:UDP-N-acetylglucosamine 2-epimerase (non-hydrolysing)